jgi:hypothetical protein
MIMFILPTEPVEGQTRAARDARPMENRESYAYDQRHVRRREVPQPSKEDRYPIQKLTPTEIVYGGVYCMKCIGFEHVDEER